MSDVIKHSKKALSVALTITTIVWSIGLFAFTPVVQAAAGDLIKAAGSSAVYLVDADGVTIHPFPHLNVYLSWGFPANFGTTFTTDLSGFKVGNDVEFRDGSLVRALEAPAVFIKSGGKLLPVVSASVFETLGYNYNNITWLPQSFIDKYTKGSTLTSTTTHPDGTLVKYASSSKVYIIQSGAKREFASTDVVKVNGYGSIPVITVPASETYSDGSKVVVKESALTIPVGVGTVPASTTPPATQPAGSGLTVTLASDTPGAASILADSTAGGNDGAQAFVPFLKVGLTAGSDGAVKVTTLKFKRTGISADADLSALYLFDGNNLGDNLLAASTSFTTSVVTFTKAAGLVTIPAGETKYVTLRADVADDVSSGKTISFQLPAAADVTTDKATVSGSFPMQGSIMSTATAGDVGYVTIANVSPSAAASVDPGTSNHEGWKFSLIASDQDMELRYMKISMTGSASAKDITNFRLQVAGVDIAPTVAAMNDNREIIFNLTTPYKIPKGQTKNVSLIFDVVSGSSRTIHFQLQEMYNANVYDMEYKVYTKLNRANTWSIIQSNTATTNTDINSGTLTISKSASSPTGNIAAGATGISLAKFDFKANGEDVRVSSLTVTTAVTGGLNDLAVYFKGSQVGSTSDADATNLDAAFTFGTSLTLTAGTTEVVEIRGDVKNAAGTNLTATTSVSVTLSTGSANARALSSSTSINTSSVTGNTLTVSTGTLLVSENLSVQDATATSPSGVAGQANVLIGSFVMTAGAGEGVTITQITMTDNADGSTTGSSLADQFQNLRLVSGSPADANNNYAAGAAIGSTVGTLTDTAATTYNFTPSPSMKLNKSQQMVVNVYADLKSSASQTQLDTINSDASGIIYPSTITATGNDTSSSANGTMTAGLQRVYISSVGTLTVTVDAGSPEAAVIVAGNTDVTLAKFKFAATAAEDIEITKLIFLVGGTPSTTTAIDGTTGTSTIGFMSNFDIMVNDAPGGTLASAATTDSSGRYPTATYNGVLEYNLSSSPITIPKGSYRIITIRGDVSATAESNAQYEVILDGDYSVASGTQSPVEARGKGSNTSLTGTNIIGASTDLDTTNKMLIRKSKMTLATSGTGGTLSNTTSTVYKFSVTADGGGDVSIKKMTLNVSITDTDADLGLKLNAFNIRKSGTDSILSGVGFFTGAGATGDIGTGTNDDLASDRSSGTASLTAASYSSSVVSMIFGWDQTSATNEELIIPAGTTQTYEIRATIAGVEVTGDAVSVRISSLNEAAVETGINGVVYDATARMGIGTSDDYLVWSDWSAASGTHDPTVDASSKDWWNGYLIKTLPTEYYTLSK